MSLSETGRCGSAMGRVTPARVMVRGAARSALTSATALGLLSFAGSPAPAAFLSTSAAAGCGGLVLTDVAAESGIRFVHENGARGEFHEPETFGSGIAWLDYDGDDLLDLYVVQSGAFPPDGGPRAANRLYRNLGDGTFNDVTVAAKVGDRGYGFGAAVGDVDGDGDPDLYVTNYGPDTLYRNLGNGAFEEITAIAGLGVDGWSTSAAFADADGDSDLDLYVVRYLRYDLDDQPYCRSNENDGRDYCHPQLFVAEQDRFYRNRGDGTFEDATLQAGLLGLDGKGLAVVFSDMDDDGDADLYVANDTTPNFLYRNRGDGTFEDVGLLSGAAVSRDGTPQAGMGIGLGDLDGDGLPEIAVANFDTETNALYLNRGGLAFEEISAGSGFGTPSFNLLGFGMILADLNGDAALDAYAANGHVLQSPGREDVGYAQRDLLLLRTELGTFEPSLCGPALTTAHVSRALAAADYDNDGDLDMAISTNGGPLRLLRNDSPAGDWIGVHLRGSGGNPGGIGARVTLLGEPRQRVQWARRADSYLSSRDPRILFSLPEGHVPAGIEVRWPSGVTSRLEYRPELAGAYLEITEPGGRAPVPTLRVPDAARRLSVPSPTADGPGNTNVGSSR